MRQKIYINGEEYIKNGKTKDGRQKYKRKSDGKIVTDGAKEQYDIENKLMAIILYLNGMTFSKLSKIYGVAHSTIIYWCDKLTDEIKNKFQMSDIQSINDIEIDELYHFLDSKKKEFTFILPLIEKNIK